MKALGVLVFFSLLSLACAEVQWGNSTSFAAQENKDYPTKNLEFKEFSPDSFGKGRTMGFFDKVFPTSNNPEFEKQSSWGSKEFETKTLFFDKAYATKDLDLGSKVSPLGDQPLKLKITENAWSSKGTPHGFDKTFATKDYEGREGKIATREYAGGVPGSEFR